MTTNKQRQDTIIDEETLKKIISHKQHQRKNKPFIDMETEDIQGIIEELLLDLISNEHITSINRAIPLIDKEHPSRVTIGLFTDENNFRNTYRDIHGEDSTFISTYDIVYEMIETLNEVSPMMSREISYYFMRLANRLNIQDTFEQELKHK